MIYPRSPIIIENILKIDLGNALKLSNKSPRYELVVAVLHKNYGEMASFGVKRA